jgi:Ca-activated chloride channel family protein
VVSFAEPAALWALLLPAGAAVAVVLRHRRRLLQQRRLASPAVWKRVMGGAPATGLYRLLAWAGAAAMVALALARPQWGELPGEESVRTRDLVVAIDVSDSMLCPDQRPTRLARGLEVLNQALPALEGNRLGVVVFAGEAYPLVPLTTDLSAVGTFLDGVEPGMVGLPGSNIEGAVAAALRLLPPEGEGRVVVLITDGENLQGDVSAAAGALRQGGVGVIGIVAGTERGGPIPMPSADGSVRYKRDAEGQPVVTRAHPETLRQLVGDARGVVLELGDREVVRRLVAAVEELRTRELEATRTVQRVERFPLFLAAAAALLATGFALSPWRRVALAALLAVACLPVVASAQASGGSAGPPPASASLQPPPAATPVAPPWWQRVVPGGSRRLARSGVASWRAGDAETAARDFAAAAALAPDQPDRLYDLGTALSASGQGEAADPLFERAHAGGVKDAAYNGGTSSLLASRGERAVQWLRQALLAAPDQADAKRNFELALRLLEEQKQQQQQQKQQQQQQDQPQQPTPTPTPSPAQSGAEPTPTPPGQEALFSALDRAEAEARQEMRSPTPRARTVEKDW